MPRRSNLFQDVVAIIHRHMAGEAKVEESAMLIDRVTGEEREVDVAITQEVAGHSVIVGVEATAAGRRATVTWVDEMTAKHADLPTSELVLVAEAGFSANAARRAKSKGVTAIAPEDLTGDDPAFTVVNRLQSLVSTVVKLVPHEVRTVVRRPDGSERFFKASPDHVLFTDAGRQLDDVQSFIDKTIREAWPEGVKSLRIAEITESTERSFTFTTGTPVVQLSDEEEQRFVCARWQDSDPPELHTVIGFRISGAMTVHVAEVPLAHRRFGTTMVAYGRKPDDPTAGLCVITEDESGGKATIRVRDGSDIKLDETDDLPLSE